MQVGNVRRAVRSPVVPSLSSLIDFIKADLVKVFRYAAVSMVSVPVGVTLQWVFLRTGMKPIYATLLAFAISTIPNYLLNRYWVWNKRSANSLRSEIVPFCLLALLGATLSTAFVAIADIFTDENLIFVGLNIFAFGLVWVLKFFVLEKYLFTDTTESVELVGDTAQ